MIVPRLDATFTSTAAACEQMRYRCAVCHAESDATVSAVSVGYAEAPFLIGQQRAADEASSTAVAGLHEALVRVIGLAGCPKCAARDPKTVRSARLRALARGATRSGLVATVIVLGVLVSFAFVSAAVSEPSLPHLLYALIAVVATLLPLVLAGAWEYRRTVREADSLVVWADQASAQTENAAQNGS